VLDLWQREAVSHGDRAAAQAELLGNTERMTRWYGGFAESLVGRGAVPDPQPRDAVADRRLVAAVQHDLSDGNGGGTATAVRMIWTGDHLDAARRLQGSLVEPARTAAAVDALR